ncbi:MAG: penicillin-binding transpeptidase domain-containing protein [Defluviitaleaceae bacterium]|nr:penicillin-binding transpeptidase domain-containing protein [Defluviitaleaceae bacterium]MCL2836651.1 penicillin-binding transpeptidase domain-containing protein [Defluviitaleaceae bacterium]
MASHDKKTAAHITGLTLFKFLTLLAASMAALVFMASRIYYYQDVHGDEFERRAINQLMRSALGSESAVIPNRGAIMDRNHHTLAYSSIVYTVFMDVRMLDGRTDEQKENTIKKTAEIMDIPESDLWALLAKNPDGSLVHNTHYRVISHQNPQEIASALNAERLHDIYTEEDTKRFYAYGTAASQIIGFQRGESLWGIESRYNRQLTGVNGRVFRLYDSSGRGVITERVPPQDGNTVILTLDLIIQQKAESVVAKYGHEYNVDYAAAIVMNPHTGEVIAMAAYPSFDLNDPMNPELITNPRLADEWALLGLGSRELANNFDTIWKNFNITHTFEPGSTFKPITIAAALEEDIIGRSDTRTDSYFCGGSKVYAGHTMRCHRRSGHGWVNLREAIAYSCNVALMEISEKSGSAVFYKYQRDFGFGELTGIDLPGEESASALIHRLSNLNASELAASSFGQRFNCTPLQAINSFSALINGGYLYKPYIVSQIVDSRNRLVYDRKPEVVRQVISQETSDWMREAMVDTFVYGTGARARVAGHDIGGKSGTADQGREGEPGHHAAASFIGYFPADDPQYVVMTIIYNPKVGDTPSASFMFTELVLDIINYKRIPPSSQAQAGSGSVFLDDYTGVPVWQAAQTLNRLNADFQFVGNGDIVVGQFPKPGERISQNATVFLMVERTSDDELAEVPNLDGLTLRQARTALLEAGFVPMVTFDNPSNNYEDLNRVYLQMPDAWQKVTPGMEVRMKVRID